MKKPLKKQDFKTDLWNMLPNIKDRNKDKKKMAYDK